MGKKIDAFRTADLFEVGLGHVLVARHRAGDEVEIGGFLLDVHCLGVKNALYHRGSPEEFDEMLERMVPEENRVPVSPASARKLLEEGIEYARALGFSPHRDHRKAARVLGGIKASDSEESFVFGREGKPVYVQGPDETPEKAARILNQLRVRCGDDGFRHVIVDSLEEVEEDEDEEHEIAIPEEIRRSEQFAQQFFFQPNLFEPRMIAVFQGMNEGRFADESHALEQMNRDPEALDALVRSWASANPAREARIAAYRAYEEMDPEEQRKLAERALGISRDCAEAWLVRGIVAETSEQAEKYLEEALECANAELDEEGPDAAASNPLCRTLATQTQIRANFHLARIIAALAHDEPDRATEALDLFDEVYDAAEDDPFRARDWMVPLYLTADEDGTAESMLAEYAGESAQDYWNMNQTLLRYRSGRRDEAKETLETAFSINPALAEIGEDDDSGIAAGPNAAERAVFYWITGHHAWIHTEGAMDWMAGIAEKWRRENLVR